MYNTNEIQLPPNIQELVLIL